MDDTLKVESQFVDPAVVLTVSYGEAQMLKPDARQELSKAFTQAYESEERDAPCIVVIEADTGGSPLVRALFALYNSVTKARGHHLVIVGYPLEYLHSLNALGLTALPKFRLETRKLDDALALLAPPQAPSSG